MSGEADAPVALSARAGGWAFAQLVRLLRATLRVRFVDDSEVRAWEVGGQPFLLAFWHRHLLLMRYAYRGSRIVVMISQSKDGELAARAMQRLGLEVVRGSSSRGGSAALRELVRRARAGSDVGLTPDGPRGPARQVQPGAVFLAAATGLPVVPVAVAANRAWVLRSWDRMVVPKPGSRMAIAYGAGFRIGRDEKPEVAAEQLRVRLEAVGELARRAAGAAPETGQVA